MKKNKKILIPASHFVGSGTYSLKNEVFKITDGSPECFANTVNNERIIQGALQDIRNDTGRWLVGDVIEFRHPNSLRNESLKRKIVKILKNSYLWEYPDLESGENNLFDSANSTDPLLINWWQLKQQ